MSSVFLPVALLVVPKSSAMRGGLVMAKPIGNLSGAWLSAILTMTLEPCWCAVTDSMALPPAWAAAGAGICACPARAWRRRPAPAPWPSPAAIRSWPPASAWNFRLRCALPVGLNCGLNSGLNSFRALLTFLQFQLRYAFDPVAGRILYDFLDRDPGLADPGDQAEILPQVLAGLHLVHRLVHLQQREDGALLFQRADHLDGVEREAFEDFLAALGVRLEAAAAHTVQLGQLGQQLVRVERVDLVVRGVGEGNELLWRHQRRHGHAGLVVDLVHPLLHFLGVAVAAAGQQRAQGHAQRGGEGQGLAHDFFAAFFLSAAALRWAATSSRSR